MPRVAKKQQQVKLEPDGFPAQLTREYLRGLHRAQIQELAKRWHIRANLKTDEIIKKLLGEDRQIEENEPTVAVPTPAAPQEAVVPVLDAIPQGADNATGTSANVAAGTTSSDANKKSKKGRTAPYPPAKEREAAKKRSSRKASEVAEPSAVEEPPKQEPLKTPTVKEVRRVRRLLVTLNEEKVVMTKDLDETKSMLAAAERALAGMKGDVDAISWRRELYEREILAQMKSKRSLWDGTPHLAPGDRERWEGFVERNWIIPRRAPQAQASSSVAVAGEQGTDGDNELSEVEDNRRSLDQRVARPTLEAVEEVSDDDDMYV